MTSIADFHGVEEYRLWLRMNRLFSDYPPNDIMNAGRKNIERVESKVSGSIMHELVREWREPLENNDFLRLKALALEVSQHGDDMRQINPFKGIMSEEDRLDAIRTARDEQRRFLSHSSGRQ